MKSSAAARDFTPSFEAVYEHGHLRPLQPLPLEEGDHVRLHLEVPSEVSETLAALEDLLGSCRELSREQWAVFEDATQRRPFFREPGAA